MYLNFGVFQFVKSLYNFNLTVLFSFNYIKLCKISASENRV